MSEQCLRHFLRHVVLVVVLAALLVATCPPAVGLQAKSHIPHPASESPLPWVDPYTWHSPSQPRGTFNSRANRKGFLTPESQIASTCYPPGPSSATISASRITRRTWKGWGTSLAWLGVRIGALPLHQLDHLLNLMFSRSGLGLNIVRYNIYGGYNPDISPQFETTSATRFKSIISYRPDPHKPYDWSRNAEQRRVLLGARAKGADTFLAMAGSPPWWATANGDVSGSDTGRTSNLKPEAYQAYADYLADVMLHYAADPHINITFSFLEPINEPENIRRRGGNQEACHFSAEECSRLIPMVIDALRKRSLSTRVVSLDAPAVSTKPYIDGMDVKAVSQLEQIHVHGYSFAFKKQDPVQEVAEAYSTTMDIAKRFNKEVWQTEWGPAAADGSDLGVGLYMARSIIESMNFMGASAWCYWQPIDFDAKWTLINSKWDPAKPRNAEPFSLTHKFHVLRQFVHTVPPGSLRVDVRTSSDCRHGLAAFYDPCHARLVVVIVNQQRRTQKVTLSLDGFRRWKTNMGIYFPVYRTSPTENFGVLKPLRGSLKAPFRINVKGISLTTLVVTNIVPQVAIPPNARMHCKKGR